MSHLHLTREEVKILRYATIAWGFLSWWDLIGKYVYPGARVSSPRSRSQPRATRGEERGTNPG